MNQADKDGDTPLYIAADKGQTRCLELLLKAGADVNQTEKDGHTPLHIASFGQTGCLKLLLADPRVDVDHKTKNGGTALFSAAMFFGTEATAVFDGSAAAGVGSAAGSGEEEKKAVGDPARCLVLMLQSGRVSRKHVKDTIAVLSEQAKISVRSDNDRRLNAGNLLALPILEFELLPGEQRWCSNCLCVQTKGDQESKKNRKQVKGGLPLGMDRCSGCKRAFYCCDECQLEHWKKGHKDECKRMAEERVKEEAAEKEAEEGGGAGGGGGAGSGAVTKKKGKKKGKKKR